MKAARRFVPWLFIAAILASTGLSVAMAVQYNLRHYDTSDGLPQVQVLAVHQGSEGYLWLGTYSGLSRYNGNEFVSFRTSDGLSSNFVTAMTSDDQGRLWVGTGAGLCLYIDPGFECLDHEVLARARVNAFLVVADGLWVATDAGLFHVVDRRVLRHEYVAGIEETSVFSLALDASGQIWVGTSDGLYQWRDDASHRVAMPADAVRKVTALVAGEAGMWIGTAAGLYLDNGTGVAAVADLPRDMRGVDIDHLVRGPDGRIWAATSRGVARQLDEGFELLSEDQGLASNITHQLAIDREGIVWLAQDNGLSKLLPGPFFGYTTDSGLLADFVRTIGEDASGRLWLGTREGIQIVPKVDGEWRMDQAEFILGADGLPDERVYSFAFPAEGEALIATYQGVAHWREGEGVVRVYTEADGLSINRTQALHLDAQGRLWIGTNLGVEVLEDGVIRPAPGVLSEVYAFRIREDAGGRLWFATQQHGLIVLDPQGGIRQFQAAEGLTDETLWDIAPAADGGMWVGSNGDGLFRVSAAGDIRQYTVADGLADDFVWQVLEDDQGQVWSYTNQGLSRFDQQQFHNYHERDGLLHLEGGATGAWQSDDGQLWFAAAEGLMRYDASREYRNNVPPPVKIESVRMGREPLDEGALLPYRPGNLEFAYAGLSFHDEDAVVFRYRLLGAGEEWSDPLNRQAVTFANLGGGDYVFEVEARNPHQVWSASPARFSFSVESPYWATVWFWVLVVLLAIGLTLLGVKWRVRQIEARRRELEGIVRERTGELEEANRKLHEVSVTDPLTGLPNRRFLMSRIKDDVALMRRAYLRNSEFANRDLIFMMIDLDHFKEVNDTYGHDAGDSVLREYGRIIGEQLRDSDYVVRWGGEEFLVVARQAEGSQGRIIAERIARETRSFSFPINDNGTELSCTCSIGVAYLPFLGQANNALNWEQVVQVADVAVYRAKEMGRDGWVCIEGTEKLTIDDGAEFLQRLKLEFDQLVAARLIRVDSSFKD